MNKQFLIDKIALITEELNEQTMDWVRREYAIGPLEIEAYLSNMRYLQEQSSLLLQLMTDGKEVAAVARPLRETVARMEDIDRVASEKMPEIEAPEYEDVRVNAPHPEEQKDEELTLHRKLSEQSHEHSIADSLKQHYLHKDLSFSLNERFFIINQLFNEDQNDFSKVMDHLGTLDSWEEVEFYLNATCAVPYGWEEKPKERKQFFDLLKSRFLS